MNSCIYEGWVRHRRFEPTPHAFNYRLYMMYLDLQEMDSDFKSFPCWSTKGPALAWFRRSEHLGDPQQPLYESVADFVQDQTGRAINGPIRLLTQLRLYGFQMNPVSYFYCFDENGENVQAVVAEVNNTPWGEQHCYVIDQPQKPGTRIPRVVWSPKTFHVSPFMPMNMNYKWHLSAPADRLNIHLENHLTAKQDSTDFPDINSKPTFDVTMAMRRTEISRSSLTRVLFQYPAMTMKVFVGIYWQAWKLWWKKIPFVPHPQKVDDSGNPPKKMITL
ncbi:MAG: DUF1365 domain-containing protein [Fuerstiella sp.]